MKCSNFLYSLVLVFFSFFISLLTFASESDKPELLAEGFDLPWSLEFLDSNTLLISEREGSIKLLSLKDQSVKRITGMWEVAFGGQGGLLDLALHPDYPEQAWIYASYSRSSQTGASTALDRFQIADNKISKRETLFNSNATGSGGRHFGSRIAFDDKGYLFLTSGDRGERDWAQDLFMHAGKVLRLNVDGTIPENNPFIGQEGAQPEIWSYGHRNPQGLVFDKARQALWLIEHGPRGGDEINRVERAKNYGWPVISYGKEYWGAIAVGEGTHKEGMEQPVKYYVPSIAPSSLLLHKGDLYSGALKLRHINHVALDKEGNPISEERLFEQLEERIRDLIEGPDGKVYFLTDQGNLYRFIRS